MCKNATAVTLIDDALVRVTRFDFGVGHQTGWHRHEHNYVITAITDCHMCLENQDGTTTHVTVLSGSAYRREAGVEHNVINEGKKSMSFVEVELK